MTRATLLLTSLIIFIFYPASGQEPESNQEITQIKPLEVLLSSPEASSLGKFGNTPVNYYSGSPAISIPLFTIEGRESTYPITLSYAGGGGIRVEEMATWVGLGWTLQGQGVISRTVIGKPDFGKFDDSGAGYLGYLESKEAMQNYREGYNAGIWSATEYHDFELDVMQGNRYETQPDFYAYQVNNLSGKILLDGSGPTDVYAVETPKADLQITTQPGATWDWKITGPDGTQYFFNAADATKRKEEAETALAGLYHSAWNLSKIISPNHQDIYTFAYESIDFQYDEVNDGRSESDKMAYSYSIRSENALTEYGKRINTTATSGAGTVSNTKKYLKAISLNGVKVVEFTLSTDREDMLTEGRRLEAVTLFDKVNGLPLRKQVFSYGYFGEGSTDPKAKRLRLDRIQEVGLLATRTDGYPDDLNTKPPHIFTYDDQALPPRDSKAQDHWGFYNGARNDQSMLPPYKIGPFSMPGGNRDASFEFARAAVLTKITYPTGGYTEFDYEPHTVNTEFEKQIMYNDTTWGFYIAGGDNNPSCPADIQSLIAAEGDGLAMTCPEYAIIPFTIDHDQVVTIIASGTETVRDYRFAVIRPANTVDPALQTKIYSAGYHNTAGMAAGDYELIIMNSRPGSRFGVLIHGKTKRFEVPSSLARIGGLRVKAIRDYSQPGSREPVLREFSYTTPKETEGEGGLPGLEAVSSGRLMYKPSYIYFTLRNILNKGSVDSTDPILETIRYINRLAQGVYGMSIVGGSHVGYSRVTEKQRNPLTGQYLGSKVYYYKNAHNSSGGGMPIVPSSNNNELNGRLEKDEIYDNAGALLASTEYAYRTESGVSQFGLILAPAENREYYFCYDGTSYIKYDITQANVTPECLDGSAPSKVYTMTHTQNQYSLTAHSSYLDTLIVREYDPATGQVLLEEVKEFYYDNELHIQPTRTRTWDSRDRAFEIKRKYAADYADSAGAGINLLKDQHKLYTEIESQVYTQRPNGEWYLIDGKVTTFHVVSGKDYAGNSVSVPKAGGIYTTLLDEAGVISYYVIDKHIPYTLPMAVQELGLEQPGEIYEKRVSLLAYDDRLNLTQAITEDEIDHYYFYGYDNHYPTGEVSNYQNGAVAYTSFERPLFLTDPQAKTGERVFALSTGGYPVIPGGILAGQEGKYALRYFYKPTLTDEWEEKYLLKNYIAGEVPLIAETSGYIDEVRFAKEGAMFSTHTFHPGLGIRDVSGADGLVTYYDYDRLGRLYLSRDHNREINKRYYYRYAGQYSWIATLESDTETATIGQPIQYYVTSDKPVATYKWTVTHMGQVYTGFSNTSSISFTPTGCGDIGVSVTLINTLGELKTLSLTTPGDISGILPVITGPVTATAGQELTYQVSVPGSCGTYTYEWDVSTDGGQTREAAGTGATLTLLPPCEDFILRVTATLGDGRTVWQEVVVTVTSDPLSVSIGGNDQLVFDRDNAFTSFVEGGCPGYAYHWEYQNAEAVWQDGGYGPTMILPGLCRGDFNIRLTVTDAAGTSVTRYQLVKGIDPPGVLILHNGTDPGICKGDYVYFQGYGQPACDAPIVSYQWYAGSGATKTIIEGAIGNKLYARDLNKATLVVTDELGRTGEGIVSFSWNCENTSPSPCPDTEGFPCYDNGELGQQ